MVSWSEFAAAEPDLAERVRACFAVRKHATLATLRRDGSPRISGTEVQWDDDVAIGSMAFAVKALDLRRDPRFALHCPTVDATPGEESGWLGDAKLAGVAREVESPQSAGGSHRFVLDLREVVHTCVGTPADHLVIDAWHADRGRSQVLRH